MHMPKHFPKATHIPPERLLVLRALLPQPPPLHAAAMARSNSRPRNRAEDAADHTTAAPSTKGEAPAKTTHFEFGGPVGTIFISASLPLFVWLLAVANRGSQWPDLTWRPTWQEVSDSFDATAFAVVLGWLLFQGVLYYVAPGKWVEGTTLADGTKLKYPINGESAQIPQGTPPNSAAACPRPPRPAFSSLCITVAVLIPLHLYVAPLTWLAEHYTQVATAAISVSLALSVYLYLASFAPGAALAHGGNSGYPVYDFFMGRELNPRLFGGTFDLKYFCELRPGTPHPLHCTALQALSTHAALPCSTQASSAGPCWTPPSLCSSTGRRGRCPPPWPSCWPSRRITSWTPSGSSSAS